MISLVLLSLLNFDTPTLAETAAETVIETAAAAVENDVDLGMRYPGIEALFAKFETEV